MPDKIGVAFVGCTHPHIFPRVQLLSGQADVWFAGCYDPDSNLTAALERDHGLKAYATPEELLDQPGVNFAIIEGWEPDNPRYPTEGLPAAMRSSFCVDRWACGVQKSIRDRCCRPFPPETFPSRDRRLGRLRPRTHRTPAHSGSRRPRC